MAMTQTGAKPPHLGLLNRISQGETNAGIYWKAWADVTPDAELKKTLAFVAGRETAHGCVFCQRIERLGFTLQPREDSDQAEKVRVYGDPSISDLEKIRYGRRMRGGDERNSGVDQFASIEEVVNDVTVDQLTRDTLRWYVTEERDSIRLLRAAYAKVEERSAAAQSNGATGGPSADAQAIMACMSQGFGALQQSIKHLGEALGKRSR